MRDKAPQEEPIELLRAGTVVSSYLGSFGRAVRETRLTASLGYLMSLQPAPFLALFRIPGTATSLRLENRHGEDRSDIFIETSAGTVVIEAKVGSKNPLVQARKYGAKWTILLTHYRSVSKAKGRIRYVTWDELAEVIRTLKKSKNIKVRVYSEDLLKHLEETGMITREQAPEIYAREINEPDTLTLFIKGQMYGCWYEEGSRLPEARYFAPHFGKSIAKSHPGVNVGISYVASIENIEIVQKWADVRQAVIGTRGKAWWNSHKEMVGRIRRWDWSGKKQRSILFLAPPRLVFNPPVQKEALQKGKGWLSKRFLSFDELFKAWGC